MRLLRWLFILMGWVLVGSTSCVGPSVPLELPFGVWGGEHVEVTTAESGANFQFDCAHGRIEGTIHLDADGAFRTQGSYVVEHGGPVREDDPEVVYPAVYTGQLRGRQLIFSIHVATGAGGIGSFTATLGASAQVFRCL